MKKILLLLIIFLLIAPAYSEEEEEIFLFEPVVEELEEFDLPCGEEDNQALFFLGKEDVAGTEQALSPALTIAEPTSYNVHLSNLQHYSLVALNNAYINMHIRGSIWVGGTLTSNDWCGTDDGSINKKPSGYESYIYNNESNMYF